MNTNLFQSDLPLPARQTYKQLKRKNTTMHFFQCCMVSVIACILRECQGTVHHFSNETDETGFITSPNYPNEYPESQILDWVISQPPNRFVRIEIEDFQSEECCDYLIVRDGAHVGSPMLGQLSGDMNRTAYTFTSTGHSLFVRFTSNGFINGRGFNASYYPGYRYNLGAYMGGIGTLNYTTYSAEEWIITLSTNMSILLEFTFFNTENKDIVTVRDGGSQSSPLIGIYSGRDIPPPIVSSGNKLYVSFVTGGGATIEGFYATYRAVNREDHTTTTQTPICTESGVYRLSFPGFCEKYYQCINFNAYVETCAPGLFFDPAFSECNFADLVDCPWFTTIGTTEPPLCPSEGIEYVPITDDCLSYIFCAEGIPQQRECLEGTLFNPVTRRCEPADQVDCES